MEVLNLLATLIICYFVFKILDKYIENRSNNREERLNNEWLKYGYLSKSDLHHLEPSEFEKWCGEFLARLGYTDILVMPEGPDGGKDVICKLNNEYVYVECKRYDYDKDAPYKVSQDIVQKLVGAMVGNKIHHGIIITTGIVTNKAIEYVKSLPGEYYVELIDGDKLIKLYRQVRLNEINLKLKEQSA